MTELPRGSEGSEHVYVNGEDGSRTRASGNASPGPDPDNYLHQYEESLRAGTAAYDEAHGGESSAVRSPSVSQSRSNSCHNRHANDGIDDRRAYALKSRGQ